MTVNHHCSVLELQGTGVLIEGPSGSGKTSLLMGLLEKAAFGGLAASFICDDQAILGHRDMRLFAEAPGSIAGKIEVRGYGLIDYVHKSGTFIDVIVRMVDDGEVERMPEVETVCLKEIALPLIKVPSKHENGAVRIIMAWLNEYWGNQTL